MEPVGLKPCAARMHGTRSGMGETSPGLTMSGGTVGHMKLILSDISQLLDLI